MKPAIVFVLTFVVAAAASTGAKVMMTKPMPPAAHRDSASVSDSTRTDTAAVASGAPGKPPADSTAKAAANTPLAAPVDSSKRPVPGAQANAAAVPPLAPAQVVATKPANDSVTVASERRVAKAFASMDPKAAAAVLEKMDINDVRIILGYVGPRPAASIMAALPPERVATLSKLTMQEGGKK